MQWFHSYICERLQAFSEGRIKKLMILMPPQHGKTELSTRILPAFLIGRNPNLRIAIASYAGHIAANFNRSIQLNIDNEAYANLFPETKLNYSKIFSTNVDGYSRTTEKFEIIYKRGSVKTVGRGGSLTSEPVDIGIIDDLYKDRDEANSQTVRQSAWDWYVDVFRTRLHNDSQQLIMNTRWHENDVCGRLIEEELGQWEIIKFEAIKTGDHSFYDPRKEGQALWEDRFSKEGILQIKSLNQASFNSLYQQDPKPNSEILVYNNWIEIQKWPEVDTVTWGLDFGKTTGTNALVRCATVGMDAYVQEFLYSKGAPVSVIADALNANGYKEGQIVWCDHIPAKIHDLRNKYGITAFPAVKGQGSVAAGIDKIKEYKMHYIGSNIRMEINNYQWVCYDSVITNEPIDDFNHLLDAIRYGLLSKYFHGR